ncbi:MAG: T9SS type A sorting domain-containing protein, partial [Bacteroidota bacterium]
FSSDKENPEAVSDGMGGVIAVWDDLRNYPSPQSSVYAGKVDSAGKATTGVKRENTLHVPNSFSLSQNYPNPFNPTTIIDYQLPVTSFVTLRVYDILGREVAMLVHEKKEPGDYVVSLDGGRFSSGVYFYRLTADNATITRKMVIVH